MWQCSLLCSCAGDPTDNILPVVAEGVSFMTVIVLVVIFRRNLIDFYRRVFRRQPNDEERAILSENRGAVVDTQYNIPPCTSEGSKFTSGRGSSCSYIKVPNNKDNLNSKNRMWNVFVETSYEAVNSFSSSWCNNNRSKLTSRGTEPSSNASFGTIGTISSNFYITWEQVRRFLLRICRRCESISGISLKSPWLRYFWRTDIDSWVYRLAHGPAQETIDSLKVRQIIGQ